jgi:hypothetical protein
VAIRKERQASRRSGGTLGAKRKERQAIERELHGKSYEEANWAKLSPAFRQAHNWLLILQGEPPLPPPAIDLYVPPKAAEKTKQFDPADPELLQSAREFIGPLPEDSEHTRWDKVPDELLEWARPNACGHEVLEAAMQQAKKQVQRRLIHKELLHTLIRKIHGVYMADPDPRAQPKTKAAAVAEVVKALNPEPDDPDELAYDEWVEHTERIKRTAYEALKPSRRSRGKAFDSRVGPPLDERITKDILEQQRSSRRFRRKRRRTRR